MLGTERHVIVISDCHLSAGRVFEGRLNPHEDFHFDSEMVELFNHYSTGAYGEGAEVELVIAGDYFDFLNVPYGGEFNDTVTEEIAVYKINACLKGHPEVMDALRLFAAKPGKHITYLIGNHDADLFFERVRERIVREWDPEGKCPSEKVRLLHSTDRITYAEGVEIRHGNQFEGGASLNFEQPFYESHRGERVLNIPWGSIFVLKILNRLKWERTHFDKVRPIKAFVLFGLFMDPWFTLRFLFLSGYYFLRTRIFGSSHGKSGLREFLDIFKQETRVFQTLEAEAQEILGRTDGLQTIIFGHTHRPMDKIFQDGKQYINTGTWTKMVNLDWGGLGQNFQRTYAYIHFRGGQARSELREWIGTQAPHRSFRG